jgi:hypothetical protein
MEARVGPVTVKAPARAAVVPIGVVTLTVLAPSVAPVVILNVAVTVVLFTAVIPLTVTPVPETVIAVAPVSPVPVRVTETAVPRRPEPGATAVSVGGRTVNVTVLLAPPGVVTLTVLAVAWAVAVMVKLAVTVVEFTTVIPLAVTPVPFTDTAEAPVRLVPVRVTEMVAPRKPELGAIEVNTGAGGAVIAKATFPVVPPGVVTLTLRDVRAAVPVMVKVAVTVVEFTTVRPLTVMPVPETFTAVAPVRPAPVRVTDRLVPRTPVTGLIEDNVGAVTVKLTVPLVPPGVVTLTVFALSPALDAIVKVAVTVVAFTLVMPLTVTPPPDTVIADVPARLVPVRVTATVEPLTPELGEIEDSVGLRITSWYSIAPTSTGFPATFRGFP